MRLRYGRGALRDLDEIFAYVAGDNPVAAARLVSRIESIATLIAEMPLIGVATENLGSVCFPSAIT